MTEHTKENILIVFALAVLVTLGWIGVYGQNENPARIPTIETTAMKSSDATYSFDIEYPSFGNLKNKDIEKDLNEKIKSYIKETVDSFKQETAENVLIFKDLQNTFFMRYETELLTSELISIRFEPTTYTAGAAHPYSFTHAFNYNLRTGSIIRSPEGFFIPNSGHLDTISSYSINNLLEQFNNERDAIEPMIRGGATPNSENYQNLLLTKSGLLIVFDPYQVAPYAAGISEVTIPYKTIAGIMDPELFSLVSTQTTN